jgi:hypothetical protein
MSGPLDLNTEELRTILEYGVEDYICTKVRVTALIGELLRERVRADDAERAVALAKSELEMIKARSKPMSAHAPKKPEYKDGIRYHNPPPSTTGADGFQSPIV